MTRRAYFYFVLTFLLGGVAGGAGVFFYAWYGGHWHREFSKRSMVSQLRRELKLNDSQEQKLNQIMDESSKKFRELRRETNPRFDALRQETRDQIRQILTPEQVNRFDQLFRQWD